MFNSTFQVTNTFISDGGKCHDIYEEEDMSLHKLTRYIQENLAIGSLHSLSIKLVIGEDRDISIIEVTEK